MPPLKLPAMKKNFLFLLLLVVILSCGKTSADVASVNVSGGATGTGGSLARFTVVGNYLYTVDKQTLRVYDIGNAGNPVFKRAVPVGFQIETIYPFKDKLFIGSTTMVHIFSISDPSNPQKLSEAISPTVLRRCDPVVAKDTVAYATLRTNGPCGGSQSILAVYDIKDITKPVQRSFVAVTEPYGLGYSDTALYVCDRWDGLVVFNIAKAYNPVRVKNIRPSAAAYFIDVVPYGDLLVCWLTDGMVLYDISSRLNPVLIKKIS
jgi:hypothetical protein